MTHPVVGGGSADADNLKDSMDRQKTRFFLAFFTIENGSYGGTALYIDYPNDWVSVGHEISPFIRVFVNYQGMSSGESLAGQHRGKDMLE